MHEAKSDEEKQARQSRGRVTQKSVKSLKLGKIFGIDIHVHPSFGLVFLWAFFQWGFGKNGGLMPLLLGCVFIVLIFVSVLIHELGHSAMAQHYGNRVLDVTLWPFGGVARIEQIPEKPRGELLIALAGPAMNLAIFIALLPIVMLIGIIGGWDALFPSSDFLNRMTVTGLVGYLAVTNLLIMAFNLIPAFPVDGGRVLRAVLTPITDRERATTIAVWIGMGLAGGMIVVGLFQRSLLLIVFGIFVIVAANAEGRSIRVESAMRRLKVGQFALWDSGGVAPHEPLTFALRGGPRDLVVTDHGRVVGMLWRTQLLSGLQGGVAGRIVADIMDSTVHVADIDDSVYDVQQEMTRSNQWAVPVTEGGQYRGIFTADRFVNLYRQIAPGFFSNRLRIPEEWRQAIGDNLYPGRKRS
jgi:Zn-dependent protease